MKPWTTDFDPAPTRHDCKKSVIDWAQGRSRVSSGDGFADCHPRSLRRTCEPVMSTSWRSASSRYRTPACSTGHKQGGCGSRVLIRDQLDVGRPHQIALIFQQRVSRRTPGRFRTRVLTEGVDPTLCCYYKSSRLKQYFKEGRALRTETVISDTRDFHIGRRVCAQNWYALRAVGESANRCLCDAEAADAQPAPDVVTFCRVTQPSTTDDGLYAAGLRFGDQ